jgi:tetratricopeptide (TPR) repeat protein
MRTAHICGLLVSVTLLTQAAWAGGIPRSARLSKESGNQFLAAKNYAGAIDWYFEALDLYPKYAEAHYNLGVAFLNGYKAARIAAHHFEMYLKLADDDADRDSVEKMVAALKKRAPPLPEAEGQVLRVVAGRLLVSGADWVEVGDRIEVAEPGQAPCACLLASYVYSDCVLTQRIWKEETLELMKPGLLAVNISTSSR